MIPDIQGGVRISLNGWKGITTPGNAVTIAAPFSVGVSGIARQFYVNAFAPPPAQSSNRVMGWGVLGRRFHPRHPGGERSRSQQPAVAGSGRSSLEHRHRQPDHGRRRRPFPTLPNPAQPSPPPHYTPTSTPASSPSTCSDVLHTIDR